MEAMKPRFTPVRSRVHELLDSGELGAVASVDVVHLLDYGELRDSYLLDPDQGGTLYDLGCYGVAWTEDILTGDVARRAGGGALDRGARWSIRRHRG